MRKRGIIVLFPGMVGVSYAFASKMHYHVAQFSTKPAPYESAIELPSSKYETYRYINSIQGGRQFLTPLSTSAVEIIAFNTLR